MHILPIFQVDAFTRETFRGNPAAICPLSEWLPDATMQKIAMENNIAETAFMVPIGDDFHIRWFTPTVEVDLCGHATLAAAFILFSQLNVQGEKIRFQSKSGWLTVGREPDGALTLNFPADPPEPCLMIPKEIEEGLHAQPLSVWKGKFDYLVEFEDEETILGLAPDFRKLANIRSRGIVVTAPGKSSDFVSRCFFPQSGVDEDPVTGSAHCMLTSYWSRKTGKDNLTAIQLSSRGGWIECRLTGDRVLMTGHATLYLKGEIHFV